jgi:hypothetical protein
MKTFATGISLCLSMGLLIFFSSCVKSTTPISGSGSSESSGSSDPSNTSYLSSIANNSLLSVVDSFTYDASNRLTEIILVGSGAGAAFSYSGSSTIPASYLVNNSNGTSSLHQLYYDGQNRITKDTALDGTGVATYWSYPEGAIAAATSGDGGEQLIDTLWVDGGNVVARHSYIANLAGTADTLLDSIRYTYTTIVNPCYHSGVASTFGPLLNNLVLEGGFTDFVSGYAISTETTSALAPASHGLPGIASTETFTWTTDSKGRAATLKVSGAMASVVGSLTFTYY